MSRPKEFSPAQLAVFNEKYGNNIEKTNVDLTEKYIVDGIIPRDGLTIPRGSGKNWQNDIGDAAYTRYYYTKYVS